ncbi:MAG: hypothetical protein II938_04830 [Alphaproteobacteria bacterium]|nr:hypothetical protein [Alphaproteobacteria bacterium]
MLKHTISVGYRPAFAYVVFGGLPTHWWTYFLKKGFYHCLIVLGNGREWCVIDPVMHFTDLIIVKTLHIESFFINRGYKIVRTTPQIPSRVKFHLRPLTCVEMVKRFLGINCFNLWTPYQLFCFLNQKKGK